MTCAIHRITFLAILIIFSCAASACRDGNNSSGYPDSDSPDVGAPTGPCATDPITGDSIELAQAALADGATKVNLSPGGCVQLSRSISEGVIRDEMT